MVGAATRIDYETATHPALQSGQVASIVHNGQTIGVLGKLHPAIAQTMDLNKDVFLFELDAVLAFASNVPKAFAVSKFPAIRRDIAVVVDDKVAAADLVRIVASSAPNLIQSVTIFDVYQGPGIEVGRKSVALGLILQETSRTLTDEDADAAMNTVVRNLEREFAAELRD
jgi:phenylalanyl-tRNA synthetase beta chain